MLKGNWQGPLKRLNLFYFLHLGRCSKIENLIQLHHWRSCMYCHTSTSSPFDESQFVPVKSSWRYRGNREDGRFQRCPFRPKLRMRSCPLETSPKHCQSLFISFYKIWVLQIKYHKLHQVKKSEFLHILSWNIFIFYS